jgi:hypothetical protein
MTRVVAYWLAGDENLRDESDNSDFNSEGQFAVAIGPINLRTYKNYELIYGETVDVTVARLIEVINIYFYLNNPDQVPENVDIKLEYDDNGYLLTRYGPLRGSLQVAMGELIAFIATQRGRIIGQKPNGEFVTEEITIDDVFEYLHPSSVFKVDKEDGTNLFFEILSLAGIYDHEAAMKNLQSAGELMQDEAEALGN